MDLPNISKDAAAFPPSAASGQTPQVIAVPVEQLEAMVSHLLAEEHWHFVGLVVEENGDAASCHLQYVWIAPGSPWLLLEVNAPDATVPSISASRFAADWPEREAEDLFGIEFVGHPLLGDFVLHDEDWGENVAPMRTSFPHRRSASKPVGDAYKPPRIVATPGGFLMPVGPVFSGVQESVRFLLETVGEEMMHAHVRLFYKYRGIEKLMEGRSPEDAVLLAERVSGTHAFAHGLAFAQAMESLAEADVPPRALVLRTFLAEWERLRSHVQSLAGIVESTGLSVPTNLLDTVEERLLQLSAEHLGHRYLFGMIDLGGLRRDLRLEALAALVDEGGGAVAQVLDICDRLTFDNSFLDRLEMVGVLSQERATTLGLVGPVARASGVSLDLRRVKPYAAYKDSPPDLVWEMEGDGYARFRVFRRELEASYALLQRLQGHVPGGPVRRPFTPRPGIGISGVEAPSGTLAYWVRVHPDGSLKRCHIMTPSFMNWHGLPDAVRAFAFQDFPIILATFGLSVADADR